VKRSIGALGASACFVALFGTAGPARAAYATFVSGTGNDSGNTCDNAATPCRQISHAISQTDGTGTVHVLPGTYDFFTATQSVNVIAEEGTAVVLYGGGNTPDAAIAVTAAGSDPVLIRGLTVNTIAHRAVLVNAWAKVFIEDCTIRYGGGGNTDGHGIDFQPTNSSSLTVSNTTLIRADASPAGGNAIRIRPAGSNTVDALLDNVTVRNAVTGVLIDGTASSGNNSVTIRNSVISGSTTFGIRAVDSGGGATNVVIEESTSANNGTWGVAATGANTVVRVRNSTITGNGRGLIATTSAKLISHGGNVVAGNTVNGAFTQTIGQQ
jgi:hypothetical protein